jgi:SAM-dependent methyltransferase
MEENWFKDWFNSRYYHQLYQHRDEQEAAKFIDKLIEYLSPEKGASMVDIACGKGRHAIHLSEKGFDVTGIDLSEASILDASQYEHDRLHFFQHDMRLPFWINYFKYAFNFFTSFGYFQTDRENQNAIRSIAQSLQPNGIFVLDYLNAAYVEQQMVHQEEKIIEDTQFSITRWYDDRFFYKKIIVHENNFEAPKVYTEKVSRFTLNDFEKLFQPQGLQILKVLGDYQLSAYDAAQSPRMILIAKKIH